MRTEIVYFYRTSSMLHANTPTRNVGLPPFQKTWIFKAFFTFHTCNEKHLQNIEHALIMNKELIMIDKRQILMFHMLKLLQQQLLSCRHKPCFNLFRGKMFWTDVHVKTLSSDDHAAPRFRCVCCERVLTSMIEPIPAGMRTSRLVCSSNKYRKITMVLKHLQSTGSRKNINRSLQTDRYYYTVLYLVHTFLTLSSV